MSFREPSKDPIGDAKRRIAELEARLHEKPDEVPTVYQLGMAYKSMLRYLDAERMFQKVLELESKGAYVSAARFELSREKDATEGERKATQRGGIWAARLRLWRWMNTSPAARVFVFVSIAVAALVWFWLLIRTRS